MLPFTPALVALALPLLPTGERIEIPSNQTVAVASTLTSPARRFVFLDFEGNAGEGLLPGNEVGAATPVGLGVESDAFGRELFLIYDTRRNVLRFGFFFFGLNGGLFDAASGIHFHSGTPGNSPFDETGPIALNLNSGDDPAVRIFTRLIAVDGSRSGGIVVGRATLTDAQEEELLTGNFYLNIHSGDFTGGELRGNLVLQ